MPSKPKKPCAYPDCPNLTDGRYCPERSGDPSRVGRGEISTGKTPGERRGGHACKIAKWKMGGYENCNLLRFWLTSGRLGCIYLIEIRQNSKMPKIN